VGRALNPWASNALFIERAMSPIVFTRVPSKSKIRVFKKVASY
jgi:hypothetical protein